MKNDSNFNLQKVRIYDSDSLNMCTNQYKLHICVTLMVAHGLLAWCCSRQPRDTLLLGKWRTRDATFFSGYMFEASIGLPNSLTARLSSVSKEEKL